MRKPTFEEIVARHDRMKSSVVDFERGRSVPFREAHQDRADLIEMVRALQHLATPKEVSHLGEPCPLVLYFANEEDRQELVDAIKEVKPNMREVKVS